MRLRAWQLQPEQCGAIAIAILLPQSQFVTNMGAISAAGHELCGEKRVVESGEVFIRER